MKSEDLETLGRRWDELSRELEDILYRSVHVGTVDPIARVGAIHAEQDEVLHALGMAYLKTTAHEKKYSHDDRLVRALGMAYLKKIRPTKPISIETFLRDTIVDHLNAQPRHERSET